MARTKGTPRRSFFRVVPTKPLKPTFVPPTFIPTWSPKPYLTTIPFEIRQSILEFLLMEPKPIQSDINLLRKSAQALDLTISPFPAESTLAISRTCKQLHDESVAVFYGKNQFKFHDVYGMSSYLQGIGSHRRFLIKEIEFVWAGRYEYVRAFRLLGECSRLNKLTISVVNHTTKWWENNQGDLFRGTGVKALRGVRLKGCEVNVREVRWWSKTWIWQEWVEVTKGLFGVFEKAHLTDFENTLREDMEKEETIVKPVVTKVSKKKKRVVGGRVKKVVK